MKKNPFNIFNLSEFKKWIEHSNDQSLVGLKAASKVPIKKLKSVTEIFENDRKAILDFHKNGGTIFEEEGNVISIKTEKGNVIKVNKIYTVIG